MGKWGLIALLVIWAFTMVQVLMLKYVNPPFTAAMAWNWITEGEGLRGGLPGHLWRPLYEISPHLRQAVLAGEDQRFMSHRGFDLIELNHAVQDMVWNKGQRGASTITMQVARTVFLWHERSWLRKAAEAYYTVLIEMCWSKRRILEMYLNTVDWGPGIRGAEAASRKYWRTSSTRLTRSQAAVLAAILPNPHRWSPTNPNARVLKRKRRILREMDRMPLLS
jgi:monofunctional biosynthetic peptidoglycan transglycosylase